ncbi:MAG: alkaline phosphatase family protein [Nocardiaceae bacterium]|nr:alkaline phosphatase family protein [Nocardiaceae bacterium]
MPVVNKWTRPWLRIVASLAAVALAACGNARLTAAPETTAPSVTVAAGSIPRPDHVVIVLMENEDQSRVVGAPDAPYLTSLARTGGDFTNSHGIAHPSQGNYVALLAGTTLGVADDSCPQDLGDQPNLVRQLLDHNMTATGYFEGLPSDGYRGCKSGDYFRKHNPLVDFSNIPASASVPFSRFPSDYTQLPTVSFVVPNICNDMHSCSVGTGDTWMKKNLSGYADWAVTHNSLLIVTFDEDSGSDDNLIPTIVYGPMMPPGINDQRIDHYSILRTLEEMYGLLPLGYAASAQPLTGWKVS